MIEVAESSLDYDRTTKLTVYAAADISAYLIINLVDRCFELYQQPDSSSGSYGRTTVFHTGEEVILTLRDRQPLRIAVADYLSLQQ